MYYKTKEELQKSEKIKRTMFSKLLKMGYIQTGYQDTIKEGQPHKKKIGYFIIKVK